MRTLAGREVWEFWGRWAAATVVGWVLGFVLAIVLSYVVVNSFYPKETNLVVGVWGIPFVVAVLMAEWGSEPGTVAWLVMLGIGALLCGFLQMPALRAYVGTAVTGGRKRTPGTDTCDHVS